MTFTEILTKAFRWPSAGDRLFAVAEEPMDDAMLVGDWYARLHIMTDGYKRAADLLVHEAIREPNKRDFLVYPIIFCYRHYLELELKSMLAMYGPSVGIEANWSSHNLEKLWREFAKL